MFSRTHNTLARFLAMSYVVASVRSARGAPFSAAAAASTALLCRIITVTSGYFHVFHASWALAIEHASPYILIPAGIVRANCM